MVAIINFKPASESSRGNFEYRKERARHYLENKKIADGFKLISELSCEEINKKRFLDSLVDESLLNQWSFLQEDNHKPEQVYSSIDKFIEKQLGYKPDNE